MNEATSFHAERIGEEAVPVLVWEGFSPDPDSLVEAACEGRFVRNSRFYPGVRALAPRSYAETLAERLRGPLFEAFGWETGRLVVEDAQFSIVTTPPAALLPFQRMPHMDGTDDNVVAVLHYLCGPEHGGTSFYRHLSTGFEKVTADRYEAYDRALREDVARTGMPPAQYRDQSDAVFERTATFDCSMNRLLAYRGTSLHSGRIPQGHPLTDDPRGGRLTANTFLKRVAA